MLALKHCSKHQINRIFSSHERLFVDGFGRDQFRPATFRRSSVYDCFMIAVEPDPVKQRTPHAPHGIRLPRQPVI